ncbi:nuclear pore membrane glycoprotein 210-like isoform X4 [Aotus nancymaae]|uniref:nuclear pore membrane glycoprotein 210-like isoform X4 n=1 Tax=Aotus nancymaae TaxID=37293 RepID=UPI0030FE1FBC
MADSICWNFARASSSVTWLRYSHWCRSPPERDPPVPSSAATEFVLVEDVRVNLEEVTIYDHLGFQIQPLPCRLPGAADDIKIACWEMRAIAMLKKRKICIQIQKFGQ